MEYSEDLHENERQKVLNGQRNVITLEQYEEWASEGYEFTLELLLDIVNGVYPIDQFIKDVKDYE